jgi:hypothetical protein
MVITQRKPQTRLSRLMRSALDEIGLPVAATAVRWGVVYRDVMLRGRSVLEAGATAGQAAEEINQLAEEVMRLS